ncbi:MAG: hypothetical protein HY897_05800 [Deltaproteobacteria bacterium]|nr:hypothetical protein [Deltaproteobacteria bacterium]
MKKTALLCIAAAGVVLCGYTNEPQGFMDDPWAYRINQWLKDNPGAKKVADDAGFAWYAPERRVSLGGIGVEARYGFWKDKLTEVKLSFQESAAGRLKEYLFSRHGEVPDNGNLVYTWFGYTTEIHLNALDNHVRFVSHELGQKAENRIKRGGASLDEDKDKKETGKGDKGKKKGKNK